jgi:hypothetical protein
MAPGAEGPKSSSFAAAQKCLSHDAKGGIVTTKKQNIAARVGLLVLTGKTAVRRNPRFKGDSFTLGHFPHISSLARSARAAPQKLSNASLMPAGQRGLELLDSGLGRFMRMRRMYRKDAIEASS